MWARIANPRYPHEDVYYISERSGTLALAGLLQLATKQYSHILLTNYILIGFTVIETNQYLIGQLSIILFIYLFNRLNISITNSYKINEPANNPHKFESVLN